MLVRLFAAALFVAAAAGAEAAAEPPRSGHPVFDQAVRLVFDRFYDSGALDDFVKAVRREVEDREAPLGKSSPDGRVDAAIDRVLASLGVSHTGRFEADTIAYFEIADVFRFAIRDDMRRLFPPRGEVGYPGIGMVVRPDSGKLFVSDVYDGSSAARAGMLV
ncbi:MAG: hypothetical protein K0S21_3282, partial [Rhizobiaceae bacterium]|nr:hypothetical protein [Rhizobiaceae bacterium]